MWKNVLFCDNILITDIIKEWENGQINQYFKGTAFSI